MLNDIKKEQVLKYYSLSDENERNQKNEFEKFISI